MQGARVPCDKTTLKLIRGQSSGCWVLDCVAIRAIKLFRIELQARFQHHFPGVCHPCKWSGWLKRCTSKEAGGSIQEKQHRTWKMKKMLSRNQAEQQMRETAVGRNNFQLRKDLANETFELGNDPQVARKIGEKTCLT